MNDFNLWGVGFSHPEMMWLFWLLPVALLSLWGGSRFRRKAESQYGADEYMYRYGRKPKRWLDNVLSVGWGVVALGVILTAVGPNAKNTPERVPEGTTRAIVVMDVSKSTGSEDYRDSMPADAGEKPDLNKPWGRRIDMGKYQIYKIMKAIEGNKLGLVTYTENGFPQGELTADFDALRFVVKEWVDVGSAPGNGSNYGKGLQEALDMFERTKDDGGKQKVIVMISDGGFTNDANEEVKPSGDERLNKVIAEIKKRGIKLVIIGVGIPGKNAIPVYDGGKLTGYMQVDGATVTTSFEEDNLRALASAADATYRHIETDAASQNVQIDWSREIGGSRIVMKQTELFLYFAGATFGLCILLGLLTLLRRRLS